MADGNKKKYIEYEDKRYILEDSRLPDPSSADNGKVLGVVNGDYALKQEEGGGGAVTSVNGKTGAVALSASDVGAYTKPASGIPASDLAAGVIPDISGKVDKITNYGLAYIDKNEGNYHLAVKEEGNSAIHAMVVSAETFATAMQQASQTLAAKADASSVYTKTEIDNKGYQTAQQVQAAISNIPDELPAVTASDNGKFLRVVSGAWAARTVPSAESNSFGGGA